MKRLLLCGLLLTWTLAAADVSGIWNGKAAQSSAKYAQIPSSLQVTLLQAGNDVTGTFKVGNSKPIAIKSGTASGSQLSLALQPSGAGLVTATLGLQPSGQITGTMTDSQGNVFTVSLKKQ
jgi:hypothetical protein